MNNIMTANVLNKNKSIFTTILSVIMSACVAFALIGCSHDEYKVEDAANIARDKYGCTKILWVSRAYYRSNVGENKIFPMQGGYYVVGIDKDGNEVYVAVPKIESKQYKTTAFEWQFDYTFSQISTVFQKYGYKYVDGIDGIEKEYFYNHNSTYIGLFDRDDYVKTVLGVFGDADELYEKLDVKLMFEYNYKADDDTVHDVFLAQQDGMLVVYETLSGDADNFTVTTYDKDDI